MENDELVTILVTLNETEADIVKAALETEGIEVDEWSEMSHSAFQMGEIGIQVNAEDEERARAIVDEALNTEVEPEPEGEIEDSDPGLE